MKTFLIADDSPEKIFMLRHFLKISGWQGEIVTAETCKKAYELIEQHSSITAAFIDYYIPLDNGPAIIRRLKETHPTCTIALVSSADSAKNTKEALSAGAEKVLCTSHRSDIVESSILDLLAEWMAA